MFHHTQPATRWLILLAGALTLGCSGSSSVPSNDNAARQAPVASSAPPVIPDLGAAFGDNAAAQPAADGAPAVDAASQPAPPSDGGTESVADTAAETTPDAGEAEPAAGHGHATSPPPVEEERQVAVPGVGRKGKGYGGGIISTPVSAYFGARERIAFIAVTDAMRKFNAEHDRDPESHEEFVEKIIEANGIQLPALYAGERYEYDPERGELMVVRPKK